jgi:hypothetical protein
MHSIEGDVYDLLVLTVGVDMARGSPQTRKGRWVAASNGPLWLDRWESNDGRRQGKRKQMGIHDDEKRF